jgi:hypothetical protein
MASRHASTRAPGFASKDLRAAKAEWSNRLLFGPDKQVPEKFSATALSIARTAYRSVSPVPANNVVGVGVGEKMSYGQHTGIWAVKFFVRRKYAPNDIQRKHLLPKSIGGLEVDVEEAGDFQRFAARKRSVQAATANPRTLLRPAQPGCSVGFKDPSNLFTMAGTFGALVRDKGVSFILSNNHVLADEDRLAVNAPIFQPGLLDKDDVKDDQLAKFSRAVRLKSNTANKVDCAIAALDKPSLATKEIIKIGAPQGVADATIDMTVHKFGRTSGYSVGRVSSVDTDVTVQYETGSFTFTEQIIVVGLSGQPFSAAGDSGSLIVERPSNKAVGLLFGGSPTHTIANHIGDVLKALRVTLA